MADYPAEWVEKAAAELIRQQSSGLCELGRVCGECDCFAHLDNGAMKDGYARQHARAVLDAVAPTIRADAEQRLREGIRALADEWLHEAAESARAQFGEGITDEQAERLRRRSMQFKAQSQRVRALLDREVAQ